MVTEKFAKIERDGCIGVVYSPGFGAGWSTWSASEDQASMCMHAEIVQAVLDGDQGRAVAVANRLHPDVGASAGSGLAVAWVPKGEAFEIVESEGSESIILAGQKQYMTA